MVIGGLGAVNTLASAINEGSQGASGAQTGFTGLLGSLLTVEAPKNTEQPQAINPELEAEINELLQFLNVEDILEVDGGLRLLQEGMLADESEILALIKSFLGIGDLPLEGLLSKEDTSLEMGEEALIALEDEMTSLIGVEQLLAILSQLANQPANDFTLTGEMKDVIKAAKMYELLTDQQQQGKANGQLKELLQQIAKKLELILESKGSQSSRMEYVQRTFTQVASEVNSGLTKQSKEGIQEQKGFQTKLDTAPGFLQFQQTSKAEQLTLALQQGGRPTNSQELIKQFESILARSQLSNNGGTQKLLIKLHPEHLGALRIELLQRDAGIVAKIMTTTKLAKDTLDTHLQGLKQAFGAQNIQVDKVEVSQQMTYQERFLGKEQQGEQQQRQEKQQQQSSGKDEGAHEESFNYTLEEALVNTEV